MNLSITELAEKAGCADQDVYNALNSGALRKNADGTISSTDVKTAAFVAKQKMLGNVRAPRANSAKKDSLQWSGGGSMAAVGAQSGAVTSSARTLPLHVDDDEEVDETSTGDLERQFEGLSADDIERLTIREVVDKYGGLPSLKSLAQTVKVVEEIRFRTLQNEKLKGEVVPRELVDKLIFAMFEHGFRRILFEMPSAVVARIYANSGARVPIQDSVVQVEKIIGKILSETKREVKANYRGL